MVLLGACNIKAEYKSGKCQKNCQVQAKEEFGHLLSVKLQINSWIMAFYILQKTSKLICNFTKGMSLYQNQNHRHNKIRIQTIQQSRESQRPRGSNKPKGKEDNSKNDDI